jgi:integrase
VLGLRFSEAAGLRTHRLDLLRRRLSVEEQLVEIRGRPVTNPPKSKAGRRKLTIPTFLVPVFEAQLADWSRDGFVFPSEEGPLRQSSFGRRQWAQAVARSGLGDVHFHDLRHTSVALMLAAGANILVVSKRLGHATPAFTLNRYGGLLPDADEQVADGLDRLWREAI